MATVRKTVKTKKKLRKIKTPVRAVKPARGSAVNVRHAPNGKAPNGKAPNGKPPLHSKLLAGKTLARVNGKNEASGVKPEPELSQKAQLEQERAQVRSELERLRAELLEAPDLTGDEVDLNVYEREKTLGLVSAYARRLEEIEAAQRAAERGEYGICERCGSPIDPERLKIFPETRMCVKCKNEVERLARRNSK